MIGAYIRVSTRSQNLQWQQDAIHAAAIARGERVTRWYSETTGGQRLDRPERAALLEDARGGRLRVLWVYRLDRLSRAGIRDTVNLLDELRTYGCQVKSVADGFSLESPAADVIMAVLAWAAQMERAAIGDRIHEARQRMAERGKAWGRPTRLSDGEVRQILTFRSEGLKVREISQKMHIPKSTVQRAISSQKKDSGHIDTCPE